MREIVSLLPNRVAGILNNSVEDENKLQEIRIRQGKKMAIRYGGSVLFPDNQREGISAAECREIVSRVSQYSMYAFEEEVRRGYMTIPGGHRIGVAGRTVVEQGEIRTIRHISCLNIRISHEIKGCSEFLFSLLKRETGMYSTLILSPPGGGKTTILRDLVRNASESMNVSLVDERSEIAACYQGVPQRDVGPCCDVIDGCPKVAGMEMAIRSMGPDVLAVDEIGTQEDYRAIKQALVSGCSLLATMHGDTINKIKEYGLFERYVVLGKSREPGRIKGIFNERGQQIWG